MFRVEKDHAIFELSFWNTNGFNPNLTREEVDLLVNEYFENERNLIKNLHARCKAEQNIGPLALIIKATLQSLFMNTKVTKYSGELSEEMIVRSVAALVNNEFAAENVLRKYTNDNGYNKDSNNFIENRSLVKANLIRKDIPEESKTKWAWISYEHVSYNSHFYLLWLDIPNLQYTSE